MLIPEIILYNTINQFIKLVYDDYNEQSDKTFTILSELFETDDNGNKLEFETYDWFNQAKGMFLRDVENQRELTINIGYNLEHLNIPTIHILMPNDSKGSIDTLGKEDARTYDEQTSILTVSKTQSFKTVYHLMITSDNASEVILIYYFLRAIFLLFHENFEFLGLRNMQFTGQDINIDQESTPPHIFHRNLSLQFDYESSVSVKFVQAAVTRIFAIFCPDINEHQNAATNPPNANIHVDYYYESLGLLNL